MTFTYKNITIKQTMNTVHKRIIGEISELENLSEQIDISFIKNKDPHIKINLYDKTQQGSQSIDIILPKDYPFKPPHVSINGIPFLETLPHTKICHYRSQIRKPLPFTGNCLHCDFITKDPWSPALGMKHILQEIDKIRKTRGIIREHILLLHISIEKRIPKEIADIIHEYL